MNAGEIATPVQNGASVIASPAADRGPLAMEAVSISKDFKLHRSEVLSAVRDVSFNLYRGAVVGLVGESGSGKSTVAKLLAGQERLTSGEVRLNGHQVALSDQRAFRKYKSEVQLVFQDPFSSLNPVHTVRYHLERPVKLHQRKTVESRGRRRTDPGNGAGPSHPGGPVPGQVPPRALGWPTPAGVLCSRPGGAADRVAGG